MCNYLFTSQQISDELSVGVFEHALQIVGRDKRHLNARQLTFFHLYGRATALELIDKLCIPHQRPAIHYGQYATVELSRIQIRYNESAVRLNREHSHTLPHRSLIRG